MIDLKEQKWTSKSSDLSICWANNADLNQHYSNLSLVVQKLLH